MKKNVILMVLNQAFPDVRVCQEMEALTAKGYEVHVLVSKGLASGSPEYNIFDFNTIGIDLKLSKLEKLSFLLNFNSKNIFQRIINNHQIISVKNRVCTVHVHDLYWAQLGYSLSQYFSSKLVIDFHENYPALIEFSRGSRTDFGLKGKILSLIASYSKMKNYERRISGLADKIIVVVDDNKKRLVEEYDVAPNKIHVVSNTKSPEKYENYGLNMNSERINIFYHGSIQPLRGLRTLVQSFRKAENNLLTLTIIGFKAACTEKQYILDLYNGILPNNVELIDWTNDRDLMLKKIKAADLCVIPHEKSELGLTTIPNKIFEYMCHGKSLLVSSLKPISRVVDEYSCGIVFKTGDIEDLTQKLTSLNSKNDLVQYSINSRYGAEEKYNWSRDSAVLTDLYEEIA